LLITYGHGLHVTLKVIEQAHEFGLNMIVLPFHMSHAFQTLNASLFKPFKTTLKGKGMQLWLGWSAVNKKNCTCQMGGQSIKPNKTSKHGLRLHGCGL
jgi:hypothetical protein